MKFQYNRELLVEKAFGLIQCAKRIQMRDSKIQLGIQEGPDLIEQSNAKDETREGVLFHLLKSLNL